MTAAVDRLVKLAEPAELFQAADGNAYVTVPVRQHHEHWLVRSKRFCAWLQRRNIDATGELARQQDVREATKVIEATCLFDAPTKSVFLRVAEHNGKIYVDLADNDWNVVEVDSEGWRVVQVPWIKFVRTNGTLALPKPVSGGTIDELAPFVNVSSQSDFKILVSWAVATLRPGGPFPVLGLYGEQGTAKSTVARVLRALVDPRHAGLRGQPKELQDLMVAARNNWVLVFDNLSFLQPWLSDGLCRLATGGGFAARQLYSDSEEALFEVKRPVILTGIGEVATRSDLLDRSITIELPLISDSERRSEAEMEEAFSAAHPRILGAMLDGVSAGLRNIRNTNLDRKPRMADFAMWMSACEPGLGCEIGSCMAAYEENRAAANQVALENSPITGPLFRLLHKGPWQGTASALLKSLNAEADGSNTSGWPKTERVLSAALRRLAPNLRSAGIAISFTKAPDRRRTRIISMRLFASASSEASDAMRIVPEAEHTSAPGTRQSQLAEAQKRLFRISDRAEAEGDYKAAIAANRAVVDSMRFTPGNTHDLDGFVDAMQELTNEQLDAVQQRAACAVGKVDCCGKETAPDHG